MAARARHEQQAARRCDGSAPATPTRRAIALGASRCSSALALASPRARARAATYKWVDEKGVVHYTDKMPPEAVNKANVELDKQGMPVKQTEPALTPEQRRAKRRGSRASSARPRERRRRSRAATARSSRRTRARARSTSRATARCRRSTAQMQSSQASTARSSPSARRRSRARRSQLAGKPVAAVLERELESIDARARATRPTSSRQEEAKSPRSPRSYDADKQRWRELVARRSRSAARDANADAAGGTAGGPPPGERQRQRVSEAGALEAAPFRRAASARRAGRRIGRLR